MVDTPLHPRNPHRGRYDLDRLCALRPELAAHVRAAPDGAKTLDFADPAALRWLNAAILKDSYDVEWQLPARHLCPPVPGRADYIHYLADLLASRGVDPRGPLRALDIGSGASCIYPILGHASYGWRFVGSELDADALDSAAEILRANPALAQAVELRQQGDRAAIFAGIVQPDEVFAVSLCNPPFFASAEEAERANRRKRRHLHGAEAGRRAAFNFSGTHSELWCKGGERAFLRKMARESARFGAQVRVFSALVSNGDNLPPTLKYLRKQGAQGVEVVPMRQGNKVSRFVAWWF